MHPTSMENMVRCYERYIAGGPLDQQERTIIVDVGGADVNGSYRDIFSSSHFDYRACDLQRAPGVSIVQENPYHIPLPSESADIVLSGQMMEHCEFFWLSFVEMIRLLKPNGLLFLIVPSAGPVHRYPVDCY